MRKALKNRVLILVVTSTIAMTFAACSKKNGDDECKTCKAFGSGGITDQETVCSETAETAFRNRNSGLEISCN